MEEEYESKILQKIDDMQEIRSIKSVLSDIDTAYRKKIDSKESKEAMFKIRQLLTNKEIDPKEYDSRMNRLKHNTFLAVLKSFVSELPETVVNRLKDAEDVTRLSIKLQDKIDKMTKEIKNSDELSPAILHYLQRLEKLGIRIRWCRRHQEVLHL